MPDRRPSRGESLNVPPNDPRNRLSPKEALAYGGLTIAMGAFVVLNVLGVFGAKPKLEGDASTWVGIAAGAVFILGGIALINGYAIGHGVGQDGDMPAGTPRGVRLVQHVLALAIIVGLGAIASWVAFGDGPRACGTNIPGLAHAGDTVCRSVFGIGAGMIWLIVIGAAVAAVRRSLR